VSIGPVQLIVLGFSKPDFKGEVIEELGRLRDSDVVRVIDSLTVYKDAEGNVASLELSQMDQADRQELGAYVGALIGFGAAGEEGAEVGAALGADAAGADDDGMFDDALDVLAEIPPDSAAAIILLEHRWAIPLRDTVYKANGFPVASTSRASSNIPSSSAPAASAPSAAPTSAPSSPAAPKPISAPT